jgi:AbrB family looped-hinge helix DNA binding protein
MTSSSDTNVVVTHYAVRLRERGQLTVPQQFRERLALQEGDIVDFVQIGDTLVLTPRTLRVPQVADRFADLMDEAGVTLADLLSGLAEQRHRPDA